MTRLRIFYRLLVRPLLREPLRTALNILAVGLGVAVVIAIELAGQAAAGSFRSSLETLVGNASFEVRAAGGVPDEVVGKLATLPYNLAVHPRIDAYAVIADTRNTVPVIGVDLIGETSGVASAAAEQAQHADVKDLEASNNVWVASDLHRKPGDALDLLMNDETRRFVVRGVVSESSGTGFVLMDIATAQGALHREGRVDRILLNVPGSASLEQWEQRLRAALPAGTELRREGSQTDENHRMLAAFRWNLRVLSYIALVVGAFLIYNTISVSVVRRRPEIGIVRALGASRRAVLAAFLAEAACLGVAGAALGVVVGRVLAIGAVRLLGATVQSLYVSSQPGAIQLTFGTAALGLVMGLGIALASAASPALEASRVSPVEAMAREQREYYTRVHRGRDLAIALCLAVAGALAAKAPPIAGKPLLGYLSALLLIAATAFATPMLISALTFASSAMLRRMLGVEAFLAARSLSASLRRSSVLVGALATAIAMMTAVGIMVGSFRQTVKVWMDNQLQADLFLRPAGDPANDQHPTMDPNLVDSLRKLPGVAAVDQFRGYEISYQGMPATLGSSDSLVEQADDRATFLSGRTDTEVGRELREGDSTVISEPFANKHHLRAGDEVVLPLGTKQVRFRIVDVFYDYANEKGLIMLDRATMLRYLPDPAPSNIAVYAAAGANLDDVKQEVEQTVAGRNVLVFTNRTLKTEAMRIFDRTFAITYALEAVAIVVAVMGIAGALLAIVIDRRRELGLLRFLGASVQQVRRLILVEAGLIGILANIAGLALGAVLSLLLIFVINKQSFGWTIQLHWPVKLLLGALTLVYATTVLAGIYPARIAARLNPIEVVHEQ